MGMVRRISALALVVTLSLVGMPLPAHAADEEPPVVAGRHVLTIHGQPLWQLRNASPGGFTLASLLEQENGEIRGVAVTGDDQPLADHTIRAKRILIGENTRSERIVGTTRTDAEGQFSFTGLTASEYLVEVLRGDEVVGSTSLLLAEGAMQVSGVAVSVSNGDEGGVNPWVWIGVGAGAFALLLVAVACANGANQGDPC